jgi:hypothetical protein
MTNNKKLILITIILAFIFVLVCCDTIKNRKGHLPIHSALIGTWGIYDRIGFSEIRIETDTLGVTVGDVLKKFEAVIIKIIPVINTYTDTINYPSGFSLYCTITYNEGLVNIDSENGNIAHKINDEFTTTIFLSNDKKNIKVKDYNEGNPILSDVIYKKQ